MNGKLVVTLSLSSLIAVSLSLQPLAQAAAPQAPKGATMAGQKVPIGGVIPVATPCVANSMSPECFSSRLNGLDNRLAGIDEQLRQLDAAVRNLPARSGASIPGPRVAQPDMPPRQQEKADGTTDNLQKQIDALLKTVNELRDKVNAAMGR